MAELNLPRGYPYAFSGDVPATNVSGVTYDSTSNKLFMVIYGSGTTVNNGRLYQFAVNTGGSPVTPPDPPPPPTAVNCVGAWSAPVVIATSTCVNQQQNVTTERTYTVTTPASGGGTACVAATGDKVHNTVVQACQVPNPCASPVLTFKVTQWPNNVGRTSGAWNISGQVGAGSVRFGVGQSPRTATAQDSRGAACAVTLNKF